jgi:RNA polymerase sigma-70 factor (ECF subfamily)
VSPSPAKTFEAARLGDVALAARGAAGEREAQRAFFHAQRARIHHILYRVLGTNRDIDDAVQEAFVAVFHALPSYRGDAQLSTFVDRIATRVALRHVRERRGRGPGASLVMIDERTPDRWLEAREALRRLYLLLDALDAKQRVAFTLHVIDGRPVAEVARLMDATAIATRVRVFRARRELERRAGRDPLLRGFLSLTEPPP